MARIRKRVHYSDYRSELAETKALRQGGFEDAYWDEDELVDHRPSKKKKKAVPRGCPGNDYNEHVYMRSQVRYGYYAWDYTLQRRVYKVSSFYSTRCIGCDKHAPRNYKG